MTHIAPHAASNISGKVVSLSLSASGTSSRLRFSTLVCIEIPRGNINGGLEVEVTVTSGEREGVNVGRERWFVSKYCEATQTDGGHRRRFRFVYYQLFLSI